MNSLRVLAGLIALVFSIQASAAPKWWEEHVAPSVESGFDRVGWGILAGGLLGIALVQPKDPEIRDRYNRHRLVGNDFSNLGDLLGTGIPGAAIATTQYYYDRENGVAHYRALVITGVTTFAFKFMNQRTRPGGSSNRMSMPSGHTSTAFTTATSLTYAYGWRAAIPGYLLATLVAASRISEDAHWASDTIAGAALGIFWGRATALSQNGFQPFATSQAFGLFWHSSF